MFKFLKKNNALFSSIVEIFSTKTSIDQNTLEELKTKLLTSDVGVTVTQEIIEKLKSQLQHTQHITPHIALETIKINLENILKLCNQQLIISPNIKPFVILLVGVNGSGKTTTIGKLAKKFHNNNYKIMLAAGDTFRAAAIEQLKIWGERNNVPVVAQKPGADSAAVIFDALQAAKSRGMDILIADTAGRLHTHQNFMEELKKIKKILQKIDATAPHEILLVLDATIGQNALNQAKQFNSIIGITGICITKLDGTAKGGAIFAIAKETKIPIRFIGVGEGIDDLKPFDAKKFVNVLFSE
ncbi:MAG: signal recognition particle-docking protein FtsY [Coxiellaceae bacterium]|jgi:fused signal recognition particle receptor|nr:signal recognition particle-docking protein FtsY [Coxiellaceae bacterium]